ncbi:aldo/keto reductase [Pseudarthrobacter enclensis]|uniref:D-threo-aldose 1-dehydrogenase n=1 Tax=Pseudarthrobacter enclensis TaxID=993070 RepID=A0ABT9RV25_9MICC|nr:aldo/keto reductase [Pseudarthrobacter enclensis]MDP9889072.1 D-threo-aldose 1-dehydrogenase [Pseudarthrobacter enclensis]
MRAQHKRPLGRTPLDLSTMSFGATLIGNFMRPISDAAAVELVDQAWDLGLRTFDTAPLYGHGLSELRLGRALQGRTRADYVLSTKAGRVLTPADPATIDSGLWKDSAPFAAAFDYSYDGIMRSVEDSLKRLLTDHLDIVYMHDVDRYTHGSKQPQMFRQAVDEGFPALVKLRDEGVVTAIGFGVNEADVCLAAVKETDSDCVLLAGRYTLLEQEPLDDLLPTCESRGIGVVLGGVYNSGILATGPREGAKFNYGPAPEDVMDRAGRIEAICQRHDVPLPAAALQFAASHPAVTSICLGSRTPEQQQNSAAFLELRIPEQLWQDLRQDGLLRPDAPIPAGSD